MNQCDLWANSGIVKENEGLAIYEKIANRLEEFLTDSGQAFFEIDLTKEQAYNEFLVQLVQIEK